MATGYANLNLKNNSVYCLWTYVLKSKHILENGKQGQVKDYLYR